MQNAEIAITTWATGSRGIWPNDTAKIAGMFTLACLAAKAGLPADPTRDGSRFTLPLHVAGDRSASRALSLIRPGQCASGGATDPAAVL